MLTAAEWNARYPVGTPVVAYPMARPEHPTYTPAERLETVTRSRAWTLGHGAPVVSVEGYAGGIALTHVDVVPAACATEAGEGREQYEIGSLDREHNIWTHETGDSMDLTQVWRDCRGTRWRWTGDIHPVNGPWMTTTDGARQPLDLVLAAWGPIRPETGEPR